MLSRDYFLLKYERPKSEIETPRPERTTFKRLILIRVQDNQFCKGAVQVNVVQQDKIWVFFFLSVKLSEMDILADK